MSQLKWVNQKLWSIDYTTEIPKFLQGVIYRKKELKSQQTHMYELNIFSIPFPGQNSKYLKVISR